VDHGTIPKLEIKPIPGSKEGCFDKHHITCVPVHFGLETIRIDVGTGGEEVQVSRENPQEDVFLVEVFIWL